MAGEGSAEDVGADGDCDEGGGEALAVVVDFAGDPVEFAGGLGVRRDGYGEDDGTGMHSGWRFEGDGQLCVRGVFEGERGATGDGAGLGADVAQDQESAGLRHAVEVAAFAVEGERELGGGACQQGRRGLQRGRAR